MGGPPLKTILEVKNSTHFIWPVVYKYHGYSYVTSNSYSSKHAFAIRVKTFSQYKFLTFHLASDE